MVTEEEFETAVTGRGPVELVAETDPALDTRVEGAAWS
jgi:hypothetical protein